MSPFINLSSLFLYFLCPFSLFLSYSLYELLLLFYIPLPLFVLYFLNLLPFIHPTLPSLPSLCVSIFHVLKFLHSLSSYHVLLASLPPCFPSLVPSFPPSFSLRLISLLKILTFQLHMYTHIKPLRNIELFLYFDSGLRVLITELFLHAEAASDNTLHLLQHTERERGGERNRE